MPTYLRDELELHCIDQGMGDPALLFIHGNSCDGSFFAPQVEHFSQRCRCIVPDLRGHGLSGEPADGAYGFHALTDDLAWLCKKLRAPRVVAVGHSLGGSLALRLAASRPDLVVAAVALDSTLLPPPGLDLWLDPLLRRLRAAPEGEDATPMRDFFEPLFAPEDDPERKKAILERVLRTPRRVVLSLMDLFRDQDYESSARAVRCPFLYVAAHKHRTEQAALRRLMPQAHFAQAALSGHFLTLEVPDQINAMLERFLTHLPESR